MSDSQEAFFLVTLPGLEDLVVAEVKEWFPDFSCEPTYGGVTVKAPLGEGLAMNLALKTPTRILLRVTHFRCRDFPKFYNKLRTFDWSQWIDVNSCLEVEASARESRLKIKKRIEETALDAWRDYQKRHGGKVDKGQKASLYVRFLKDDCTVSLDTSGDRLHKRGVRQSVGEAPIRETIAAAMIQLVAGTDEISKSTAVEVIDPMMGSGTFLLEAIGRDLLIDQREFGFESFKHQPEVKPSVKVPRPKIEKLVGFELDAKTVAAAKANFARSKVRTKVQFFAQDFFASKPLAATELRRWVLVNPPYGERLKIDRPLGEYYTDLFAQVERVARPDRAFFLLPTKAVKGKFSLPLGWKVLAKLPFSNGGIGVVGFVFGRD